MNTNVKTDTTVTTVPTADGSRVPLLVHRPQHPKGWLVWAHGGSWQAGSTTAWAPVTATLAAQSGWAVVSVDYRLDPAHKFPAAIFDMLAALDYAETQARDTPVAVGGDSAGGTIAAITALTRRNTGGRVPLQVLAYPPLDPDCTRHSYHAVPGAFPTAADMTAAWRLWLGEEPTGSPVTPLQADSLAGLTPAAMVVGGDDPVRDDVTAYADRLDSDGVASSLRVLPGVAHADVLRPRGRVLPELVTALTHFSTYDQTASSMEGIPR